MLNPINLGLYTYSSNNPVLYIDPDGKATMSASDKLINFIASYESFSAKAYRGADSQNQTIGYGHVIQKGEDFSKGITKDQAKELLKKDLQDKVKGVNKLLGDKTVTQQQFDALVDFAYNAGVSGLSKSSLWKAVKNDSVTQDSFTSSYVTCNGTWLLGLWRRRNDEWEIWNSGEYNKDNANPTPTPASSPTLKPSPSASPTPKE